MSYITNSQIKEMVLEIVRDELSEHFVFNEKYKEKLAPLKIGIAMMRRILDNSKDKVKSVVEKKLNIKLEFIPSDCNKSLPFNDHNKKLLKFMEDDFGKRKAELKGHLAMSWKSQGFKIYQQIKSEARFELIDNGF